MPAARSLHVSTVGTHSRLIEDTGRPRAHLGGSLPPNRCSPWSSRQKSSENGHGTLSRKSCLWLDVGRRIRAHQSDGQHELHISSLGVLSLHVKFEPRRHDFMRNVRPPRKKFLAARAPHCGCARRLPCTHATTHTPM